MPVSSTYHPSGNTPLVPATANESKVWVDAVPSVRLTTRVPNAWALAAGITTTVAAATATLVTNVDTDFNIVISSRTDDGSRTAPTDRPTTPGMSPATYGSAAEHCKGHAERSPIVHSPIAARADVSGIASLQVKPPSMGNSTPLTYSASSEAR